jgi:hypothetical protein
MEIMINKEQKDELLSSAHHHAKPMLSDAVFRPMLFSTPMVKALLNGTKTQTRRVIKDCNEIKKVPLYSEISDFNRKYRKLTNEGEYKIIDSPAKIGDIIWVRETFIPFHGGHCEYKATISRQNEMLNQDFGIKWKPSLFMPKSACRIWNKVTNLRIERLQDISEQDAINEGVDTCFEKGTQYYEEGDYKNYTWHGEGGNDSFSGYSNVQNAKESYQSLWYKINGKKSWDENPFVWVYDFEVALDCPHGFR